ncbi:hypothetical protein HY404_02565 [Candidatus Microgenomates bacterium]|nr:hypothetical protein [Candidatus Microgenomates bacterium]
MPVDNSVIWLAGKLFAIVAFAIYVIFAAVVVRQVYLMTKTISVGFELPVQTIAWIHLIIAVAILLFVVVFL